MCQLLIVEVNTWLLTVRRHVNGEIISSILNALFYITWILIRNIFYPFKLLELSLLYIVYSKDHGSYLNFVLVFVTLTFFLNYLNAKWTYDLFLKKASLAEHKEIPAQPVSICKLCLSYLCWDHGEKKEQ